MIVEKIAQCCRLQRYCTALFFSTSHIIGLGFKNHAQILRDKNIAIQKKFDLMGEPTFKEIDDCSFELSGLYSDTMSLLDNIWRNYPKLEKDAKLIQNLLVACIEETYDLGEIGERYCRRGFRGGRVCFNPDLADIKEAIARDAG